jgi:hypothetical protein
MASNTTDYDVTFGPGSMGFGVETPDGEEEGSIVTEVTKDSVAEKAGIKVGDYLIKVGKEDITHLDHESTVELIVESERPLILHFSRETKSENKGNEEVTSQEENNTKGDDKKVDDDNNINKNEKGTAIETIAFPVLDAEYEIIEVVKEYMKNMTKEQAKDPVQSVEQFFSDAFKAADLNDSKSLDKGEFESCLVNLGVSPDLVTPLMKKLNLDDDKANLSYQEFIDFAVESAKKIPPRGKRRSSGMFGTLGIVKGLGSRWKKKAMSSANKRKKEEEVRKDRLSRVANASTDVAKAHALLLEVINDKENKLIDSSISEEITTLLDHAHDVQERVDILNIIINAQGVTKESILEQCNDAEVRSIHRLADQHHEEKKKGERTPTPIESDSDIDAFDEESDDEHPEMNEIQSLLHEKTKGYVKKTYEGVDENAEDYVDPDWLITKDDDFSDDDPFDDIGNDEDPEYRELAMDDTVEKYKKGLETVHKAYSQMPGSDKTQHYKAINRTFDSINESKNRLGVVPFLRLCKDFNLITRRNKILQNSRAGVGYEDMAMIEWIAAKDDPVISASGKLPVERDEAKKIFKKVAGKQNQYNFVDPPQLMKVFFQLILLAWPRMNATAANHERELWSNTALKTFRKVVKNDRRRKPQYRTLRKNGAIDKLLRRIRAAKTTKRTFHFDSKDVIEAEVIEDYKAPKEELDAFEGDIEDDAPFPELFKGDKIRILALQNDDDDEKFFNENDEYEAWLPIRKDRNAKFQVEKKPGQYWLGEQMTLKGKKIVDDYAHFEHRGTLPANVVRILRVTKEIPLTPEIAAIRIQRLARGSMYRMRRRRIWDAATRIETMARGQQQRKRYRRALHVRSLQASCVIERLLDRQPDFPKLETMLDRLKIRNKREAIDSTIARSRGFTFAQGNFQDDTPGNLGQRKHDDYRHFTKDTKDPPRKRREPPVYTGKFAKGKPDRVRGDIPKHDPKMDTCQDLFSYGLEQLYKAYCSTFGSRKLVRDPTFEKMGEIQNTINLQGFAAICTDFKLVQPTFKGAKMATLYVDKNGDIRFTEEGHMSFTREFLKATYQRWCVFHQDPKDTHTAIRSWKNLADILAELAWESYKEFCKTEKKHAGMKRPEVAAALYTRMCLAEDDAQILHNLLMGFGRGMTFADGKHPGLQEKYVYQMMKYSTRGATHPVDRMRIALHERKTRGMDIKSLFTHLDEESYGWEHPSGILKPESMWKALGIILEANLITKVEWNLQILPYLMKNFKGMENARASGIYQPQAGIDYVKFCEWINKPLPNFHHEGHGKTLESVRHRHRAHYTKRATGGPRIRRDEYGNPIGEMTEEEYQEMQRQSKTPPPVYDPEDDVVGRAFGKNSGYHDHWDASGIDDHFNMNDGNNQFGLPMVDQMLMSNNNNTSVPPQNNIISQMPVPPQKPNLGGNKGSPLVRRTQMV